jgi:hypothetical protein
VPPSTLPLTPTPLPTAVATPTLPPPLAIVSPHQLPVGHGVVPVKGLSIEMPDSSGQTPLQVQVSTTHGRIRLHASGVKIRGNNSRAVLLSGNLATVNRALDQLTLLLGSTSSEANLTIVAAAGHHSCRATIKIRI